MEEALTVLMPRQLHDMRPSRLLNVVNTMGSTGIAIPAFLPRLMKPRIQSVACMESSVIIHLGPGPFLFTNVPPYSCPPLLSSLPYAVLLNSAQEQE
jgi:hypothetical protein